MLGLGIGLALTPTLTPPQVLTWAPAAIGAAPVSKTIRVMNNGCAPAQLTWAVVHLPDPDRPLEASAAVDDYGKVRVHLAYISPTSRLYLAYISAVSRLNSPISRLHLA